MANTTMTMDATACLSYKLCLIRAKKSGYFGSQGQDTQASLFWPGVQDNQISDQNILGNLAPEESGG